MPFIEDSVLYKIETCWIEKNSDKAPLCGQGLVNKARDIGAKMGFKRGL